MTLYVSKPHNEVVLLLCVCSYSLVEGVRLSALNVFLDFKRIETRSWRVCQQRESAKKSGILRV